jgi:hypothetical protein
MFNNSLSGATPMDWAESRIQNRVADFLSMKAKLFRMHTNIDANVRVESKVLMDSQYRLEVELNEALVVIDKAKAGTYNMGDMLKIGLFATRMESHIKKVQELEKGTLVAGTSIPSGTSSTTQKLIIAGVGLWVISKIYRVGRFIL